MGFLFLSTYAPHHRIAVRILGFVPYDQSDAASKTKHTEDKRAQNNTIAAFDVEPCRHVDAAFVQLEQRLKIASGVADSSFTRWLNGVAMVRCRDNLGGHIAFTMLRYLPGSNNADSSSSRRVFGTEAWSRSSLAKFRSNGMRMYGTVKRRVATQCLVG